MGALIRRVFGLYISSEQYAKLTSSKYEKCIICDNNDTIKKICKFLELPYDSPSVNTFEVF
jgi:hypothetical protein